MKKRTPPCSPEVRERAVRMLDKTRLQSIAPKIRIGMAANGVDMNNIGAGVVSAVHGPAELDRTAAAFRSTIRTLRREGHPALIILAFRTVCRA